MNIYTNGITEETLYTYNNKWDKDPEENTRLHEEYCEWVMENVEPAVRFWSVLEDNL